MSYNLTELVSCPELQDRVDNYFAVGDVGEGVIDEAMPLLQFLVDGQADLQMSISPGNSKVRRVDVIYDQFLTEDGVEEDVANPTCVSTDKYGNNYQSYELDTSKNLSSPQLIALDDFIAQCESNPEYFARVIQKHINRLDRKVATQTAEQLALLTGKWNTRAATIDGASLTDSNTKLNFATKSSGNLEPFSMQILRRALQMSLFSNDTLIVDGGNFTDYFQRIQAGCCTDGGVDLSEIQSKYGYAVAYDQRVQDAFDVTEGVALRKGAMVLLNWTRAGWDNNVAKVIGDSANYVQTAVVSPKTGLPYDLVVKNDCGNISIRLTATAKLVAAPSDMFPQGSDYNGINFANILKIANS
jgi:hypothetical protein